MKATITITYALTVEVEVPEAEPEGGLPEWASNKADEVSAPFWEAVDGLRVEGTDVSWVSTEVTDEGGELLFDAS